PGGGLGTALGGGSSQSVFGGGGGADFLAKLTQGLAIGFMVCAVYLAYASTHSGSSRLKEMSQGNEFDELAGEGDEIDYERIGPNPMPLPEAAAAAPAAAPAAAAAPEAAPSDDVAPSDPAD